MAIAGTVTAIKFILATIKVVQTIRDLNANSAGNNVTLGDFEHIIRTENANFFVVISSADLARIRNTFYRATLPTIVNANNIKPSDLQLGGIHYHLFAQLISDMNTLIKMFYQLMNVFLTYRADLQIDNLISGQFLIVNVLGLLLHMHSTYATLRRIQFGAASLDDPRLINDTHTVLNYLQAVEDPNSGLGSLNWVTSRRRLQVITGVTWTFIPPTMRVYKWSDNYRRLVSTPEAQSQFIRSSYESSSQNAAIDARAAHIPAVESLYARTVSLHVNRFRDDLKALRRDMEQRLAVQGAARRIGVARALTTAADVEAMLKEREALACIDDPNLALEKSGLDDGSPPIAPPAALDEYCAKFAIEVPTFLNVAC